MDVNAIGDLTNLEVPATVDDAKYDYDEAYTFGKHKGTVLAIRTLDGWVDSANMGSNVGLVLDNTAFYAESGGQVYDTVPSAPPPRCIISPAYSHLANTCNSSHLLSV